MALKHIIDVRVNLVGASISGGEAPTGPALNITGNSVTIQDTPHHLTFTVNGIGAVASTYQWTLNGVDIPGADSSVYVPPVDMVGYLGGYITAQVGENEVSLSALPIVLPFNVIGGQLVAESDLFIYHMFTATDAINVRGTGSCEVLVLAGGGAGGPYSGQSGDPIAGGGGAGGAIFNPFAVIKGSASPLAITVGQGGVRTTAATGGANGGDSSALGVVAKGGGGGGQNNTTGTPQPGKNGGSGGGGGGGAVDTPAAPGGVPLVVGQGTSGGNGTATATAANRRGAGGGGASVSGGHASGAANGNGGAGFLFSSMFGEDFGSVESQLGLVGAAFGGGGGGGTGSTSRGGGGLGGLGGGGEGGYNPGTPVLSTDATGYGSGGGGGGDNTGTGGEDKGGSGSAGLVLMAVPKLANDVKIRLWIGDDTYRDDDGNPSSAIAAMAARLVELESPLVSVGGMVVGDCKVGAQWFLLHPDQPKSALPVAYDDGDTRYSNTSQNKIGGGNVWFYHAMLFPAIAAAFPAWQLCEVYRDTTPAVHEWNFAPTQASQITSASLAIANDIIAAINNPMPEIVVYSAGGGANVPAEAVGWITSNSNYTAADIKEHFAIIQHGRNNWFYGYDIQGGIDARDVTRQFTIAITNQNPTVYDNGWAGPGLETAFFTTDFPSIRIAHRFSTDLENAFKVAVGAAAPVGVPSDSTFSATRDISDAGSHVFALCPGRVAANMSARMTENETLNTGDTDQHLIYNSATGTSRTRVLWHGFRRSAAAMVVCPPV